MDDYEGAIISSAGVKFSCKNELDDTCFFFSLINALMSDWGLDLFQRFVTLVKNF